ncbi:3-dehydroquinate synthase [Chlamydiales bacterium STE3]|nr:3-dehydroquinate synthase [Chlamydiales bacterium STE3]
MSGCCAYESLCQGLVMFHEYYLGSIESSSFYEDLKTLPKKTAVITDCHVEKLHAERLIAVLKNCAKEVFLYTFPAGEKLKTRATKEHIENEMMADNFSRDSLVIGFGGGVVTDLAGFVAATFCRGVPLLFIPTTLIGMVDASIGGKTAVNTPYGKNLIGSFYFPEKTYIDLAFLHTLPIEEIRNGMMEAIKHGVIADRQFFLFLRDNAEAILNLDNDLMLNVVSKAIAIKQKILRKDPLEKGKRRLLNFGHTFGHAIELVTQHALSHGEAVALGILAESHLSYSLGFLSKTQLERIIDLIGRYQCKKLSLAPFDADALLQAMRLDKKGTNGKPRFVLLDAIGRAKSFEGRYCEEVDPLFIAQTVNWLNDVMHCH